MNSGVEEDLNSIHIYSSRGVAIVGNNGTILVSEDSGSKFELWRKPTSQLQNKKVNLKKITGNDSKMIIVGERGTVLLSDDAGLSWFSTPLASSIDSNRGVIQSNNTALLFGEDGFFDTLPGMSVIESNGTKPRCQQTSPFETEFFPLKKITLTW